MKNIVLTIIISIMISGCAMNNQQTGGIGGGLVGGVVGNQIGKGIGLSRDGRAIATFLGVMIGATAGSNIGKSMDKQDARATYAAVNNTKTGHTTAWSNPDTGYEYDVTPKRTYKNPRTNDYCREVIIGEARIGGQRKEVYGTACRQPDGSWKMQ